MTYPLFKRLCMFGGHRVPLIWVPRTRTPPWTISTRAVFALGLPIVVFLKLLGACVGGFPFLKASSGCRRAYVGLHRPLVG